MAQVFNILGYYLEFFVDGKFKGTTILEEPDRDLVGYYSRQDSIAEGLIVLDNGNKINKGIRYYTRMYPLCGKRLNNFNCKIKSK